MPIAHADYVAGLAKGLAVLECFGTERQRLNTTQAAERAGLTRAAARRHLLTLAHLGYLETEDGQFWLSPRVLRFSGAYLASARLPRVIQPTLNRLAAETQDVYSAAVLDGDEVVIVARSAGLAPVNPMLAYGRHLGARLPAHATSTGRVLLAAQDYCVAADEHELGVHAVAVPLRTRQGQTVAALNVVLAPGRLNDAALAGEILPRLREAAGEIRQLL